MGSRPARHDDVRRPVRRVSEIVTRIIEDADKEPGRWLALVSHIDSLPADDRDRLLAAFEALDPDSLGDPA